MKYIWEAYDFQGDRTAHGMMVTRRDGGEVFIVGYLEGSGKNIAIISLRDGSVIGIGDAEAAAAHFNDTGYVPVFAHMPAEQKINLCLPPSGIR